ncbi:MAG: phosphoribosylamine--glycine ligase [Candidatus Omnitrophica bacterium]|nr:phosphoribosylamine--glycine ligase [Candidatus Omnitrophota bacterium]MBU4149046.1 phosphoribosylamine--glycine ligase [Candidatus Omnitrophota bacterium]
MRVLVVGSGGREHTLVWKIAQDKSVEKVFCAPGNGGIREQAEIVNIKADDIAGLLNFAKENKVDLTIVGPEAPLVKGIVDSFLKEGLRVFGPTKELAMLEGSKVFAKKAMKKFGVPTADFEVFTDANKAKDYLKKKGAPIVVKADGLAAGKGVIVAQSVEEAEKAIDDILVKKIFGAAGNRLILEDCLEGEEASILVFTDGKTIMPLVTSQDHKRIFDNDKGPNTGGMGAYSPAPVVSEGIFNNIIEGVFKPLINGLANEGKIFKGVLYAGVMLTEKGPMVLEFNVRFGDPETQAVLPRLKSDLVEIMGACIDGSLDKINLEWDKRPCLCVVAASRDYPGPYEKNKEIRGLEEAKKMWDVVIFHAGTSLENGKIVTNGGRVLGVAGLGHDISSAKKKAYDALDKIKFDGIHYRKDIGDKAIKKNDK